MGVNFFGHAALASWQRPEPDFVLGSMLPDFASMIRTRPPDVLDRALADGVSFHHATDRVFHELDAFRALSGDALSWLCERHLRRSSARAVAHIGVEILLDVAIAEDELACRSYTSALVRATSEGVKDRVAWQDAAASGRFSDLCSALRARGVVRADVAPEYVAFRVRRALAGRPRLELDDRGEAVVREWVEAARGPIAARAPDLIADLKASLSVTIDRL